MADQVSAPPAGTVDRFGLNIHEYEYDPAAVPLVAEARIGWVRLAAWWRRMELTQGTIDFGYLDRSVDAALAHGLKVLIVFVSIPAWANGSPPNLGIIDANAAVPPTDPKFFRDFVTAVVKRFGSRVGAYEIWNEPNYKVFWNGDYGRFIDEILISGAQAVKAANPAALTLGPATDSSPAKFQLAVNKACRHLDVLSCHLYNKEQSAETFLQKADQHHELVKQQCDKPLWVTEFGVDSWQKGNDAQAKQLVAAFDGLRTRPYLQRLFLFEWRDGHWPYQGQKGWGLVSNAIEGFRRKKSFWDVQDLALRWLKLPGVAQSPQPADGATNVPLAAALTWSAGRDAKSHRISVGQETPSLQGELPGTTFAASTPPREHGRTYLWRVDTIGAGGSTTGSLWRFTVEDDPAASVQVIVRVQQPSPFFLTVVQGQCCTGCAPVRSLVFPGTPGDLAAGGWTVAAPATGPTDLNFLRPVGKAPSLLTITLSGLRPGQTYQVFGHFVTATEQLAKQAGLRLGLSQASMTLYGAGSPGVKVVRQQGRWEEREVQIGSARAENGGLTVLLDTQGAPEAAGWSGLRLEMG